MRHITLLVIHCSAVRSYQTSSAAQIDQWHKARGWRGIGYHFVVRRDGSIEHGRAVEEVGAHAAHHNLHSIGICYEGGLLLARRKRSDDAAQPRSADYKPADTRTPAQKRALYGLLTRLRRQFPDAMIVGHNTLDKSKACPCFDAVKEYASLQPNVLPIV